MSFQLVRNRLLSILIPSLFFLLVGTLHAQAPTGSLSGVVTDPSGAVIAKALVRLIASGGASLDTTTNKDGVYEFKGLTPGNYTVKAVAKGFALFTKEDIQIVAGQTQKLNIGLTIQVEEQKVEVTDSTTKLDVDPSNNAGMVVLKGQDLEALSDDPDELQSELQALAGPSAGPNGGQIYIDGFTGGTLPPKASIREIRINQNPFSAEYDRLGYGRVEIFTKPGTDQFHGQLFMTGNTAAFNSRNPFEVIPPGTQPPGYDSRQISANIGGPLASKKASFFFNIERRDINELSVVSAQIVDPASLVIAPFSAAVSNPRVRTELGPRIDYQLSTNNTLTARYQYERNNESNNGTGQFNLPSLAFNQLNAEHQFQVSDTQILNAKTINETRFQFIRETTSQSPQNTAPSISVQGAFNGGGNNSGLTSDTLDRYELQNYTSMSHGKHFLKFGSRLRANRDSNASMSNFNGSYSFGSRVDPTVAGCAVPKPPSACPQISGLNAYRITLQYLAAGNTQANLQSAIAHGGGASFYSITTGTPIADVTYFDAGLYFQDDWRLRPNITLSYGLRYESQNNFGDHADFAPRVGVAWGIDGSGKKSPKTVLRVGFGIFYDRFAYDLFLRQERLNGIAQQQFIVPTPAFFDPNNTVLPTNPNFPSSSAAPQTIYQPNPNLRAPYTMQSGVTLERQLTKYANLAVTYLNSRGVHQFFTNFINANPNGTPPPPEIFFQYQSEGIFKQKQLIVNSSIRMGTKLSLFGYYTLNYVNSDASGAGSFPSNPFDVSQDYGRASFDIRHRVFFGGTVGLPYNFRLSPFLIAQSGVPFNITTGQDLYQDNVFNTRPTVGTCTPGATGVRQTPYGCFNLNTLPGEPVIPINLAEGPGRFSLNLRLSKTFGFVKKAEAANAGAGGPGAGGTFGRGPGGPGGRGGFGGGRGMDGGGSNNYRYNLTFSVSGRNIFNNVNLATPIGNLSSPFFNQSNGLAGGPYSSSTANRRIDLQVSFNF